MVARAATGPGMLAPRRLKKRDAFAPTIIPVNAKFCARNIRRGHPSRAVPDLCVQVDCTGRI